MCPMAERSEWRQKHQQAEGQWSIKLSTSQEDGVWAAVLSCSGSISLDKANHPYLKVQRPDEGVVRLFEAMHVIQEQLRALCLEHVAGRIRLVVNWFLACLEGHLRSKERDRLEEQWRHRLDQLRVDMEEERRT